MLSAKTDEKSNLAKGLVNRNPEKSNAKMTQNISSIIDAPPSRASIYILKDQKTNINIKQACKDKIKMPGIIQMIPFLYKNIDLGIGFDKNHFPRALLS